MLTEFLDFYASCLKILWWHFVLDLHSVLRINWWHFAVSLLDVLIFLSYGPDILLTLSTNPRLLFESLCCCCYYNYYRAEKLLKTFYNKPSLFSFKNRFSVCFRQHKLQIIPVIIVFVLTTLSFKLIISGYLQINNAAAFDTYYSGVSNFFFYATN